ncbi:MAG: ATP-binding protein [Paludibacteraceae bacterium]|nr:ATP-binding protein [Paludibacteraceae bacterium]
MLESFFATHDYLVSHVEIPIRRGLMDEIEWKDRLIAVKGGRGVGKTDFLLGYAKQLYEQDPAHAHDTLYVNFNNFYFTEHTLYEFAGEFVRQGGKTLILDQLFKYPNWSKELKDCYFHYTSLRIVFTASPLMRLNDGNPDIGHLVKVYNLRGYSFREYLCIQTHAALPTCSLDEILKNHVDIARSVCAKVKPLWYFPDYLKQGYYPYREVSRDFSETLLKTMNMMLEVDILLIKQIDVSYLTKIRQLLYLLMMQVPCGLNISEMAEKIDTSRATIMNYIKCLKDARLLNLLYQDGKEFPMKPSKIYLQNPNLCYAQPTREVDPQAVAETFFYSALHGSHKINVAENATFLVNRNMKMDIYATKPTRDVFRYSAVADMEMGKDKLIPLWLFGFLY